MTLLFDIEANGLLNEATKVWCGTVYDTVTKQTVSFDPSNIKDICSVLENAPSISGHNLVGYDLPLLEKMYGFKYKGKVVDTYLLSRILYPDIENGHSLDAWGKRFGIEKPPITDWSAFTPEIMHRNKEDIKIQTKLYEYLVSRMKELTTLDSRITNDKWKDIIAMETKTWTLVEEMCVRGWQFNLELAYKLHDELDARTKEIEKVLVPALPAQIVQVSKTEDACTNAFKADGTMTIVADRWFTQNWTHILGYDALIVGDFCKIKFEPFNLGSSAQIKNYLLEHGWEPVEYNFKKVKGKKVRDEKGKYIQTSPKVPQTPEEWEIVSSLCNNENISLLAERNKTTHRRNVIRGLIEHTGLDHRVRGEVLSCDANTARMKHKIVVNIPKKTKFYGQQMRSMFIASPGKILVGCDASALEARCEAHYVYPYDRASALELVDGDIHSLNADIFKTTRDVAKSGKYAILYGCAPQRLAATIGRPLKLAKKIYEDYWDGNPGLKELKAELEKEYANKGYLVAIDGRPLTIRSKHALINTLLQSCGAIAVKYALCIFTHLCKRLGYEACLLGIFHDEFQVECDDRMIITDLDGVLTEERYADVIGRLMVLSMKKAGEHLKLNVPLDAEYKVGKSWDLTH